eukprot:4005062-Pyramimonas_sp.AAC.1
MEELEDSPSCLKSPSNRPISAAVGVVVARSPPLPDDTVVVDVGALVSFGALCSLCPRRWMEPMLRAA